MMHSCSRFTRWRIGFVAQLLTIGFFATSCTGDLAAQQTAEISPTAAEWLSFENCTAYVEHAVDIPAMESGVLQSLAVDKNDAVKANAPVAQMDAQTAEMEIRLARLQYEAALELAKDTSDLNYQKTVLEVAKEELASLQSIRSTVSDTEMRRAILSVRKGEQAVVRAEQARNYAAVEAESKLAAVEAAQLRLRRRSIVAPIDGVITAIERRPGQWVETGQTIARIENMDHLVADCMLPIEKIDMAHIVGAQVTAEASSQAGMIRLSGNVASFDHLVSGQGYVRIHTRITNLQRDGTWVLLPGMKVHLHIAQSDRQSK